MATIKLENPNDVQELEHLRILTNKLRDWIRRRQPRCEESLYQVDSVRDGFEELAEIVCDDLGYYEDSDLVCDRCGEPCCGCYGEEAADHDDLNTQ